MIGDQTRPALARGTRLSTDKATGEPVLLFPEGAVHLSETAHAILSRCDGRTSLGAIIADLSADFAGEQEVLREDVVECLNELHRRKLIMLG